MTRLRKGGENMAMTTDDPKPFRVNLRINEEMNNKLISITKQTGMTVAEYVRGLIDGNKMALTETQSNLLEDIFQMAKLNGVTGDEFLKILDNELTQGTLIIENGMLKQERS